MSQRFLLPVLLLVAAGAAVCALWSPSARAAEALPRPTTLILVRHAEKDPAGDARDPGLSEAGRARAERLAHVLGSASVTHLFASEYHRSQDTLAPLSKLSGKSIEIVSGAKTKELCAALDALPGGSIVVVAGHSNTIPEIAAHFGLVLAGLERSASGSHLPEDAFDRMYAITLPPKASKADWSLLELRY